MRFMNIMKNKKSCYIKINHFKITCEKIPKNEASLLNLVKIFEKAKQNTLDNKIIEKEPIDVLFSKNSLEE